jgi:hypothetical protein
MFPRGGADATVSRLRVREEQQRRPHSVSANQEALGPYSVEDWAQTQYSVEQQI